MFDDQVRAAAWQEYQDLATLWNSENSKIDAGYYDEWKQDHELAISTSRIPQPKRPYHLKFNVIDDGNGWPKFTQGPDVMFAEPVPAVPVPKPQDTLTYTDSLGVKYVGKIVGQTPFGGPSIVWTKA